MTKLLLLPNRFKKPGIVILIPSLILTLVLIGGMKIPASLRIHFSGADITTDVLAVILLMGAFLTGFSKEKLEDDGVTHYRLNSLLWSVYINYAFMLAGFFLLDAFTFLTLLVYNMYSVLLLYILIFNFIIFRNSKMASKLTITSG